MRMIFNNKKYAFSLTELLIVLVVLAVLFAALAPIITKRRNGASIANESVWNYVNDDEQQKDAYYDPGVPKWPSTAYIGLNPKLLGGSSATSAKVVIKASKTIDAQDTPQRQIQFRYGSGDGVNSGSLFFDDRANLMLAGNNDSFTKNAATASYGNTIAGLGTFARIGGSAAYNTAYGANVMKGRANNTRIAPGSIFTAVGQKILYNTYLTGNGNPKNIFIGSNSGQSEPYGMSSFALNNNVAVGSNTMGTAGFFGARNVLLGYMVGNGVDSDISTVKDNVFVGSQYYTRSLNTGAQRNVILGYDTFIGGPERIGNLTAAGYGACNSIDVNRYVGSRTCLGYKSGGSKGIPGQLTPDTFSSDEYDHVFLGGIPEGGFNGRAVLEVHNQKSKTLDKKVGDHKVTAKPKVSPTVVMNSNIVIRGGLYVNRDNGSLYAGNHHIVSRAFGSSRRHGDRCRRKYFCCGPKGWYWGLSTDWPADSYSASSIELKNMCTNNLASYSFGNRCPQLVSDIRLKENITANSAGLDEIVALMPYNYTFKDDKAQNPQTGIIAQDLQKIFPVSVTEGKDGYLRIRWDEMFYAAINSIKVLDKKLETLTAKITGMEKDVKLLKSSHKDLQRKITSLNIRAAKLERK